MVWKKNIIEIHQGVAELFAFECITRWRCSRWAKKSYCNKTHSSTARNEMKTGIVPFKGEEFKNAIKFDKKKL